MNLARARTGIVPSVTQCLAIALCGGGLVPLTAQAEDAVFGQFTAIQGNVFVGRATAERPIVVEQHDILQTRDVIQTEPRSRTKVLLEDDTLVALGEDSRLQIMEGYQDRTHDRRIVILKLSQGRVRVLVGGKFNSPGSRVELRTPTGVVSAHEGSFAAWVDSTASSGENPGTSSGVTNIGRSPINFSASGEMVTLISGQSSVAQPRRPPSQPELFRTAMAAVNRAVQDTQLRDRLKPQSPRDVLRASGGPDTKNVRPAAAGLQAQAANKQPPLIPVTPPAVISGAATAGPDAAPSVTTPVAPPAPVTPTAPTVAPTPTPVAPVTPPAPAPPQVTIPKIPTLPPALPAGSTGSGSRGRGGRDRD